MIGMRSSSPPSDKTSPNRSSQSPSVNALSLTSSNTPRTSPAVMPHATNAATIAPADVPPTFSNCQVFSMTLRAPRWAIPLTPPPSKTASALCLVISVSSGIPDSSRPQDLRRCFLSPAEASPGQTTDSQPLYRPVLTRYSPSDPPSGPGAHLRGSIAGAVASRRSASPLTDLIERTMHPLPKADWIQVTIDLYCRSLIKTMNSRVVRRCCSAGRSDES